MSDKSQTISFAAGEARRVEADLGINVGKMRVHGGATKMFEGEFTCSVEEWQPVVEYSVQEDVGKLSVLQPELRHQRRKWNFHPINEWDLRFGEELPLDLVVEINAGAADLNLDALLMRGLDLELNSGSADVRLTGSHPQLNRVDFELNAGRLDVVMHGAFPRLSFADFELNACKAKLDLVGPWERDLDISVEANASWLTLSLPRDVGVQITTETSLAMVSPVGLKKQRDQVYVNEAFGATDVTLRLDIVANVGKLNLQIVDKLSVTSV